MRRIPTLALGTKLALAFAFTVFMVFFVGNSIQLTVLQNHLREQGEQQVLEQQKNYAQQIAQAKHDLIIQFKPLMGMLADFATTPLLARISETDHSDFDIVDSLQNCFTYYLEKEDIKQCTDLLVYRFGINSEIAKINQSFITSAIHFLIENEDLVGIRIEDWNEKNYIGFSKTGDGSLQEWVAHDQLSQLPFLKIDIEDEEGEYLGKIVFAYSNARIENLEKDRKLQLEKATGKIKENIRNNRKKVINSNIVKAFVFSVVLVAMLFLMSIRVIIRPIQDLKASADRIAQGHLDTRSTIQSNDEVGSLAQSLNNMAANLQATMTSRDSLAHEVEQRKLAEKNLERTIKELERALAEVKTLSGMLPICASCKKIRDDKGYWNQIESYISTHTDVDFSHSICPNCIEELYGEEEWFQEAKKKQD